MAVDLSFINSLAPLLVFLIVIFITFAVLSKTEIFGDKFHWTFVFTIAILVALLFLTSTRVQEYVQTVVPWFAVFAIALVFLMALTLFAGNIPEGLQKGMGIVFVLGLLLVFIISGIVVFSGSLAPYLPGTPESIGNPVSEWIYSPPVLGGILLVAAALGAWLVMRTTK